METKVLLESLFRYTIDANQQVWDCAMTLGDEEFFRPLAYSVGSIFIQLLHTMGVEYWWLHFVRTGELRFVEDDTPFRDRAFFRAHWDAQNATNLAYIQQLTPPKLDATVRPEWFEEGEPSVTVWQAVMQVVMHSMDHRAQTLAMLHSLGAPTVEQDYLNYLKRQR